jgi:O-acetyl-ADP-ribose deacetylase (regulator of RNase III)
MKFIFVDFDENVIKALQIEALKYSTKYPDIYNSFEFIVSGIVELSNKYINEKVMYVSPANSFGSMGGGIDYYINKFVLKDVEDLVKKEINKLNNVYENDCFFDNIQWKGKKYIHVGDSLIVKYNSNKYLAVVPTMEYPKDINNTDNVYRAMISLMINIKNNNYDIDYLIISGMGSGIGGLDYNIMAEQMLKPIFNKY